MTLQEKIRRWVFLALQRWKIIPKSPLNYGKLSRTLNLALLYARIKDVEGCIVECGVAQGWSLSALKLLSVAEGKNRPLFGFDTFAGFPETDENGIKGQFCHSLASVKQNFLDRNVPLDGITFVEGDVCATLPSFDVPVAFLHIDVDLYDGYKAALENLWKQMAPGGVVIFDDYAEARWSGATKAVDEFVRKNGLTLRTGAFPNRFHLVK